MVSSESGRKLFAGKLKLARKALVGRAIVTCMRDLFAKDIDDKALRAARDAFNQEVAEQNFETSAAKYMCEVMHRGTKLHIKARSTLGGRPQN